METTSFTITVLTDNASTTFAAILLLTQESATFFFDEDIQTSKTEKSNKLKIALDKKIQNPVGFIISRMERLAKFDQRLLTIELNHETFDLRDTTISGGQSAESSFLGDMFVPDNAELVISVIIDGLTTASERYTANEVRNRVPDLTIKTISIPLAEDILGSPRYCRNPSFNKALFGAKASLDDDLEHILVAFSEYASRIREAALMFQNHQETKMSLKYISKNIAHYSASQWRDKTKRSSTISLDGDLTYYNTHEKCDDISLKFDVADLLALEN